MRRAITIGLLLTALTAASAGTAAAGGSVWHFEGEYRPGDIAVSATSVAWSHNSDLGTPTDGPYLIYLAPEPPPDQIQTVEPDQGMLVGIVEIVFGPYQAKDGEWYGPNHAIARFEIPDVPPGSYQVSHCNEPCTKTFGDIIGGWGLTVAAGSGGRSPEEIAREVRASLASYRDPSYPNEQETTGTDDTGTSDGLSELIPTVRQKSAASATGAVTSSSVADQVPMTDVTTTPDEPVVDDWGTSWMVVIAVALGIGLLNLVRWQTHPVRPLERVESPSTK